MMMMWMQKDVFQNELKQYKEAEKKHIELNQKRKMKENANKD